MTAQHDTEDVFVPARQLDHLEQRLVRAYLKIGVPVDQLAYTPEFERLVREVTGRKDVDDQEKSDYFRRLLLLRKAGLMPRLFRSVSAENE